MVGRGAARWLLILFGIQPTSWKGRICRTAQSMLKRCAPRRQVGRVIPVPTGAAIHPLFCIIRFYPSITCSTEA